jgi:hypothetical protein
MHEIASVDDALTEYELAADAAIAPGLEEK